MSVLAQTFPRRLFLNSASIFGGEAVARCATLLMAVIIARRFGSTALGEYGYALAFASILLLVPDFGMHLFAVRELSTTPERLPAIFWNVHWMKLFLTGLVALFVILAGTWMIPEPGRRLMFYVLAGRVLLQTYSQVTCLRFLSPLRDATDWGVKMKKIVKIMAAIDFSHYSKDVLEYAGAMAESTKSELIIVNVINNRDIEAMQRAARMTRKFSVEEWVQSEKEKRLEVLQGLIEETSCGHLPTEILFRTGVPFKELMNEVEEKAPQLLVMGPKGRTDLPEVRVGSTAEKAFRRCPVPVLTVRAGVGRAA